MNYFWFKFIYLNTANALRLASKTDTAPPGYSPITSNITFGTFHVYLAFMSSTHIVTQYGSRYQFVYITSRMTVRTGANEAQTFDI